MDPVTGFLQTGNVTLTLPVEATWNATTSPVVDPDNVLGKIGAAVIVLIIIVGLTGNVQVLVVIARCPRLHRSYNVFIASLSATDLVFNALILPFFVDSYLYRSWRYPNSLCQFLTYFGAMMLMTSGLHIGLIALNRYFLIVHPRRFLDVSSRSAIACQVACIWIVAFFIVLPGAFGWHAAVGYSDQLGRCNYLRSESRVTLSVIFCVGFLLPCAIMGYCYIVIWRTATRSERRICLHRTKLPGGRQPLDLPHNQALSSDVPAESASFLRKQQLVLLPREPASSTRGGCRQTLGCFGAKSLGFVQGETVVGSPRTNPLASPGSLKLPGSLVSPGPFVSLGPIVSPGPLGSPRPLLSPGPSPSPGPLMSPGPLVSPRPLVPPGPIAHPGPLLSPEPFVFPGHFCKEPMGPLSQEAKEDLGNDGLSRPRGGESLAAPSIIGQAPDERGAVAVEPLHPHLIEQQQVTSAVDCAAASDTATVLRSKTTDAKPSACCLEFWCTQAEPSVTVSYTDCDSRASQAPKDDDDDDDDVDRSRSQINRIGRKMASSRWRRQSIAGRGRLSSLRMILVVFLAFVLTYLPFTLMNLFDDGSRLHRSWYMTASLGFWAGSCVNPIIYGIMNKQFRTAYGALLSISIC